MRFLVFILSAIIIVACNTDIGDDMNHGIGGLSGPNAPVNQQTGWSVAGELITFDQNREVSLQAVFPKEDEYTIQFWADQRAQETIVNGGFVRRAEAEILWSVENSTSRVISVADGVSISGVARGVKIRMKDVTILQPTQTIETQLPYSVVATVARGGRPTQPNPPILVRATHEVGGTPTAPTTAAAVLIAAGQTLSAVPVPRDCGVSSVRVTVLRSGADPTPTGNMVVVQNSPGATPVLKAYRIDQATNMPQWVPLVPGATSISISAVGVTAFAFIEWGIDG